MCKGHLFHDWEYIETIREHQLRSDVKWELDYKGTKPFDSGPEINYEGFERTYHIRVCLRCHKKEDTITPRKQIIKEKLTKSHGRKELAKHIWENKNGI